MSVNSGQFHRYCRNQELLRELGAPLRQLVYVAVLLLASILLWCLGAHYHDALVQENGVLENAQLLILAFAAAGYAAEACVSLRFRPLLFMLSALCAAAFVRELDAFFDVCLPLISWKFCWLFPAAALWGLWRARRSLREPFMLFLRSRSYHMMLGAFVIAVPLAQCIGHRSFVADVLGSAADHSLLIRRFLEEPFELMGYLLLLMAVCEFYWEFLRSPK